MANLDAAFFDLGGVVMASGSPREVSQHFEGDPALVVALLMGPDGDGDHPWHRIERGELSMAEAWPTIQSLLDEHGITRKATASAGPGAAEWLINQPVVDAVVQLREAGVRTSIVTNNAAELRNRWWPVLAFDDLFDDIVDSHQVGMRKPNPAIYQLAMERVGARDVTRTVFLDDIERNVVAAHALGMHAILVGEDPQPAVDELLALAFG